MRILVTGSEGSLMQWTIKHLVEAGHQVLGVDNYARYEDYELTKVVPNDEYDFHKADLTDPAVCLELTADVDGVINAAALIYGVKGFHENPADILSNDVTIHRNILEGARHNDVERVAYVSSSMVYEQDDPPHREEDVWDNALPSTDYGLSKLVGERYSKAFAKQYGVEYTLWRPFNIITPYERGEDEPGQSHVFADFMRKILVDKNNPMEIFGDGEQIRCFTWIDEVGEAIASHSFSDAARNEAFNLANEEPINMKELARRIFEEGKQRGITTGEELEFEYVPIYEDDVKERIPITEKASQRLGWDPQMKVDRALTECIDNLEQTEGL